MAKGRTNAFGRGLIYGITVIPLLATISFYFLEYVPSREEYLLNLRFRTLGVIGKQIETKLESVSSGLAYGRSVGQVNQAGSDGSIHRVSLDEYVGQVFPELQRPEGQPTRAKAPARTGDGAIDPDINFAPSADRIRFTISPAEPAWEAPLSYLIAPLTEDAGFDDVLLADAKTSLVLFQRLDSAPRVRDVTSMLKRPEAKEAGLLDSLHRLHSDGEGADTDLLRDVDLDGSAYRFLAQPLTIRVPRSPDGKVKELLLCALIRSDKIRKDAMHVPPKYLLWIIVPLFAAALSGPLLKLILMRRTGRFATRDVPLLALFSCLAMAMLTVVLLAAHLSERNTDRLEAGSKKLADRLAGQVQECFRRGREVLRQVDAFAIADDAAKGPREALNRTGVWSWAGLVQHAPAITRTNLEFLFWTSDMGDQIEKWTPLQTNTPFYPQRTSNAYLEARAGGFWRARNDPGSPFTAELLISPTTASPIAVLTMPSRRHTPLRITAERRAFDPSVGPTLTPAFISVVETPRDLLSPVIPPDMGFALVRRDGAVLYHSDHDRILNENFFRETENSRALVDAVAAQSEKRLDGRYRGSDVVFYVRPIREISGIPWTIIVFREVEPWQTLVWQVGSDVLLLYLALWTLPVLAIPVVMLAVKWRKRCSWNACRILALRYFWPTEHGASRYAAVAAIQCALIAIFLAVMAWFGRRPDGAAGTVLLADALLSPAVGLALWTWLLHRSSLEARSGAPASGSGQNGVIAGIGWRNLYIAALCLTLVSVSVLPVTGFFHLAFRLESEIDIRHWQSDLAERVLQHCAAAEAAVRQPGRLSPDAIAVAMRIALPPEETGLCDQERLYESWGNTIVRCRTMELPEPAVPAWRTALLAVRARGFGLDDATVAVGRTGAVTRTGTAEPTLALSRAGGPDLVVKSELWSLQLLPRSIGWWMLAILVLAAGCVWVWTAAQRLFLFDFHEIPLRTLGQIRGGRPKSPLLVLGLPRSGKDTAVKEFIDAIELAAGARGDAVSSLPAARARIDLKVETLDEKWLQKVLQDLGLEAFRIPPAVDVRPIEANAAAMAVAAGQVTPAAARSESGPPAGSTGASTPGEPAPVGRHIPEYTHVTNLEAALNEKGRRNTAMRLLDVLARAHTDRRTTLVVTSAVDPIVHLDIIFPDQNEEVERNHLPEAEFGHWVHVFLQFERVLIEENRLDLADAERGCRKGARIDDELWAECRWFPSLRRIGLRVAEAVKQRIDEGKSEPTHEELILEVCENATALYNLLWSSCTRPEKLLLVQLAQTGLANPRCKDTLDDLLRKRLIALKPFPMIVNESFERFLLSAASSDQIRAWENEAGESRWLTVRNVLLIVLVFVLLMIGVSQDHALKSVSEILTAVIGGVGGVFKLIETVGKKWGRASMQMAG